MANISNSVLCDEIDFIAAVAKSMATIYTATHDCYDLMVREKNPDDLKDGVDAALAVRGKLDDGIGTYSQFSNLNQWLSTRATAAGVSGIDGLLSSRCQRSPYSYDQYVYYPNNSSHLSASNIFYDEEIILGSFVYGDVFDSGDELPMSGSYNHVIVEVENSGGISSSWVLSATVNYSDNSTGSEEVVFSGSESLNETKNINNNPINGISEAETYQLTLEAGTTGMVAGQCVLLSDNSYPVLIEDAATGTTELSVSPSQIGWYVPGDEIWIQDSTRSETGYVENINYEDGSILLATATTEWYLSSESAFIKKTNATGDGFQEQHIIASVTGTDLVFSGALQHSYHTDGFAHRLIKKVLNVTTKTGGDTDFEVDLKTISERTISQ